MNKYQLPLSTDQVQQLHVGDTLLLSGKMFVMRDAAHKRVVQALSLGDTPCDFKNSTIYYMGPCPRQNDDIIGSCGPTTSLRMDSFAPLLYDKGVQITIGKGQRNDNVIQSIVRNKALYLAAMGGCGALYKSCVLSSRVVAYLDLGAEALLELTVQDFPVIVAVDSCGKDIYS